MGETALYQAVEMESLSQVETLLKYKSDPNIPQADGLIPLHAATIKQNIQLVEILLKHGSNPNYENKLFSQTPVHFAIKHSVKPAILMLLVRYNGSVSTRDKNKKRPIDYVECDEIRETLNMLRLEKEDAFKTPQKQPYFHLTMSTNSKRGSGLNFTPSKTNNYVFNKLVYKNESEYKDIGDNHIIGSINNHLIQNLNEEKEFRLEEVDESKRRDSENILIENQCTENSKDLDYSHTEYVKTMSNNQNNYTVNIENRNESFNTKEGAVGSKLNTPRTHYDCGISEINPLDTLNSNGNTITKSNRNSLIRINDSTPTENKRGYFNDNKNSISKKNTPENIKIPYIRNIKDNQKQESSNKKKEVSEFMDNDSLEENEELLPIDLMSARLNSNQLEAQINMDNHVFKSQTERTEVEITYTPTKISYIISELPQTSKNKNSNDVSDIEKNPSNFKEKSDVNSSDNKLTVKKLNFQKIKYHNKQNENRENYSASYQYTENNLVDTLRSKLNESTSSNIQNKINRNIKNTIHLSEMDLKYNTNTVHSPRERKINLSPDYKYRLNVSKVKPTSPTNSIQHSYRNNTSGSNNNTQVAIPYNTHVGVDEEKYHSNSYNKNHGQASTRTTSANYYIEDFYPPRDKYKRRTHTQLNDTLNTGNDCSNSNRTIIHYGEPGSNQNKRFKKISIMSSLSRRNSPKSFCRRSPGVDNLDTIYCMNTESSRSNISTVDAKKLHDWLNSIGMQNYYNNFLENGLFSIEELIKGMEDVNTRITYNEFEDIGIRKPGHIYRMLVKLEYDARFIDESVFQLIFDKNKKTEGNCNNINLPNYSLKVSGDKYVCCGLMNKVSSNNKNTSYNINTANNKPILRYDLINWLKVCHLPHLRKNFLHNGFDSIEYFILQMFSSYPFDDQMIEDNLHIYSKKERKILLSILNREVMLINNKLLNLGDFDTKSFYSEILENLKPEKNIEDEGCKMCVIF